VRKTPGPYFRSSCRLCSSASKGTAAPARTQAPATGPLLRRRRRESSCTCTTCAGLPRLPVRCAPAPAGNTEQRNRLSPAWCRDATALPHAVCGWQPCQTFACRTWTPFPRVDAVGHTAFLRHHVRACCGKPPGPP
jgi:hypothetical protein